jgi:hypothetical protein
MEYATQEPNLVVSTIFFIILVAVVGFEQVFDYCFIIKEFLETVE